MRLRATRVNLFIMAKFRDIGSMSDDQLHNTSEKIHRKRNKKMPKNKLRDKNRRHRNKLRGKGR